MPTIGQQLDGLCYIAWNTLTNAGQTGDAGNHVLKIIRDGNEISPANTPVEIDPTGCPGLYKITLTGNEMSGKVVTLAGISSTPGIIIIPVQLTTVAAANLVTQIWGSSSTIWTDQQIAQWANDALGQIAVDLNCIWQRECIATLAGTSVLRLPNYVRSLARVTWRGRSLEPQSWEEMQFLTPATVFLDFPPNNAVNREAVGKPLFYAPHPTDPYHIKLHPAPDESFSVSGEPNPYAPQHNSPSCIIEFWRQPTTLEANPITALPAYIERRTQKAYVLWKAFAAEGKGQDMQASAFYQTKYNFLIDSFRKINEGCYVSKRYSLGEGGLLDPQRFRYPKPMHNPNFERTIF